MERMNRVVICRLAQGKGSYKETKINIFFILCKGTFDPVNPFGSLEGLSNIKRFRRGSSWKDFIMVDGIFQDGLDLVKEGKLFLKGGDISRTSLSEGNLDR